MTDPFQVKDFSGGIVDDFDDAPSKFSQRCRNFLVDKGGKLYERDGTVLWSTTQTPSAERVSGLKVFPNLTKADPAEKTAFVYSHNKLWVSTGGNVTPARGPLGANPAVGPVTLTEVTAVASGGAAVSIAKNASLATRASMQLSNQHVYVAFSNRDTYAQTDYHPSPRKIWGSAGTADTWYVANVGVPYYSSGSWPAYVAGGGAANYIYYYTYVHSYNVRGLTFVVESDPKFARTISAVAVITGAATVAFSAFAWPVNGVGGFNNCYSVVAATSDQSFQIRIYRTTNNDTVARYVGAVVYPATTFTDNVPDASLGAPIYTADGTAPYSEPPPCKLMHINGDVAYFGGFNIGGTPHVDTVATPPDFSILQSVPGVPDSAPEDFVIETPEIPVRIDSIDSYTIGFFARSVWRLEGIIDAFGNGSPVWRPISEKVGLLHPQGVLHTDRGIIFASLDGAYFTDGFSVKRLTDQATGFWLTLWKSMTQTDIDQISAAYHVPSKRFFFGARQNLLNPTSGPNSIVVGDLAHQTELGTAAISDMVGLDNPTSAGNSFLPTALEVFDDTLLIGENNGYIMAMAIEPSNTTVQADVAIDSSLAAANFKTTPIVPDYISPAFTLGSDVFKKWVTRLHVTFKMPVAATKIFALVTSYNDMSFRSDATNSGGKALKEIRESAVPLWRRAYTVLRHFAKNQLRCLHKQIRISKSFTVLWASLPAGVRTYPKATCVGSANTAQIITGTWPAAAIHAWLATANDGYVARWQISAVSGDTVTVLDPGNTFPTGLFEWQVMGYPKDVKIGLHSYAIVYQPIQGQEDTYTSADSGAN